MRNDLLTLGIENTMIPNVLKSVDLLKKEIEKTSYNKKTKAVKEAARKLKNNINKIMEYSDYGELFVFHKFIYDNVEEYLLFLDWIQQLPKSANKHQISLIYVKVGGILKINFPLQKSIKDQEQKIDWGLKKEKNCIFQNLFEDSEDLRKENNDFDKDEHYKSLYDIVNEKYENIGGELILKSRLDPGIKVNIRRDYTL